MTIYKLVSCQFKWFGLQGRVENIIQHVNQAHSLNPNIETNASPV